MWGHRHAPLVNYQKENGQYKVDYTLFHQTEPINMPECSAQSYSLQQNSATTCHANQHGSEPTVDHLVDHPSGVRTFNAPSHHRAFSITGSDASLISASKQFPSARRRSLGGRFVPKKFMRRPSSLKTKSSSNSPSKANGYLNTVLTKSGTSVETIPCAIMEEDVSKRNSKTDEVTNL